MKFFLWKNGGKKKKEETRGVRHENTSSRIFIGFYNL